MSTLTANRLATLPRVNLLPPEIGEARHFRKVQRGHTKRAGATPQCLPRAGSRSLSR